MKKEILKGWKAATPVALGYIPLGLAFGITAAQQGLTWIDVFFLSLLVYAGSAQFIALAMIAANASAIAIIGTTFLVNLRHMLMSASLSPHLKHLSTPSLALISLEITDETYAAGYPEASTGKASKWFYFALNSLAHGSWLACTVLGCLLGNSISDPQKWGLDFALPAMFIGLIFTQLKGKSDILVSLTAGILSVIFALFLKDNFNIIIATMLAAMLGAWLDK